MMKLYEYKAKVVTLLLNYKPKSEREKQLIDHLITKANQLRAMTLARFLMDIHLIITYENVSEEFKDLLRKLIPSERDIDELLGE